MPDRVRIHDVAAAAGVSVTTVSHALSGRGKVSDGTRTRIRLIAADLGYMPNRIASALRLRRTNIIGLLSDRIATTPFAGRIVLGAQEAAAERGMTLMLMNSGGDANLERRELDALIAQQVDAVLYAMMSHQPTPAPVLPATVPVVLVNAFDPAGGTAAVVPDEIGLAETATALLLEAGHRRIVHLTITDGGPAVDGRIEGYRRTMRNAGLQPHVVRLGFDTADAAAGRDAFTQAMHAVPDTTAVFAFNDPMAMGVYQAASDLQIQIPERLSVVGVDDLQIIAAQLRPGLTTLALPHYRMGRWAVGHAIARLDGAAAEDRVVRLDCALARRGSVSVVHDPR